MVALQQKEYRARMCVSTYNCKVAMVSNYKVCG